MIVLDCIDAVSWAFNVPIYAIERQDRSHRASHARFAAMYVAHRAGFSPLRIGRVLRRDRSTVLHGVKRAEYMLYRDQDFASKVFEALLDVRPAKF